MSGYEDLVELPICPNCKWRDRSRHNGWRIDADVYVHSDVALDILKGSIKQHSRLCRDGKISYVDVSKIKSVRCDNCDARASEEIANAVKRYIDEYQRGRTT